MRTQNPLKHLILLPLVGIVLLCAPQNVHAQSVNQKVQGHFDQGIKHYVKGEYDAAILEFRKAYRLMPEPIFLYNIARSQVKLNRCDDAFESAERALSSDRLKGETRAKAQSVIASCRVFVTADRARNDIEKARETKARAERESLERERVAAERERIEAEKERTKKLREMEVQGGAAASDDTRFGALGWIGAGFMVVGAGALTATAIVSSQLSDQWDDYRAASTGGNLETYRELQSDIEKSQNTAKILLFSGAGLAAAGAAMVIIDLLPSGSESGAQALIPRVGPDGAGVDVRVDF